MFFVVVIAVFVVVFGFQLNFVHQLLIFLETNLQYYNEVA
jgi:hypothetical protein